MQWSPRQARYTLLLFLLIFAAGQVKAYLTRPIYPDFSNIQENWPLYGHLVDATVLKSRVLEVFPPGTTIYVAISALGLESDPVGSGFSLPRASVLYRRLTGWSVRPMTQRERWVWRIPMDLYDCKPHDLQRIKGIGPSLAGKIHQFVQNRGAIHSIRDLNEVTGIGQRKLLLLEKELSLN